MTSTIGILLAAGAGIRMGRPKALVADADGTPWVVAAARALGCDLDAPFMTLSFLSLSPIPQLKLTDQGLIDAVRLKKTTLFVA